MLTSTQKTVTKAKSEAQSGRIPAIQGLRGLAVAGVLLFHVEFKGIDGGYLGVDVFFVISGFVIANLLRGRIAQGSFSLADFYLRRAWRLMPALAVVLLLTAAVFSLLTPSVINQNLRYSLLTSIVGLSNFYYSATIDYFDSGISNPVLHTWSLGVEEQFYLVFPCLLLLIARWRRNAVPVLGGLAALSFGGAVLATVHDQSAAFYMPWFRAWEFLVGALLVYIDRNRLQPWQLRTASFLGLALVLPAFVWYGEHHIFPGVGALAPVLGTALLIVGSGQDSWINRLLTVAPIRKLGDASYSVYLVHWPLVCLIGMFFPLSQLRYQLTALLGSLLLGYLLWKWVEMPVLRRYRRPASARGMIVVPMFMAAMATLVTGASMGADALWRRHPDAQKFLLSTSTDLSLFRTSACFLTYKTPFEHFDTRTCLDQPGSGRKILVLGDSMAANIVPALRKHMPGATILQATSVDYRPGNSGDWPSFTAQLNRLVWDRIESGTATQPDEVVFFARWDAADLPRLRRTIERLHQHGITSTVIGPSPEFYISLPLILSYSTLSGIDLAAVLMKHERRALDLEFELQLGTEARYVSAMQLACPQGRCEVQRDGGSLYFDKVHFSRAGAELFVSRMSLGRLQ